MLIRIRKTGCRLTAEYLLILDKLIFMNARTIFAIILGTLIIGFLQAQQRIPQGQNFYNNTRGVLYDKELAMDFKLHTNGFALGVNIGQLKSFYLTRYVHISIGEIKHAKEFRQNDGQISLTQVSRSFIFGKQNNFYNLRVGVGEKRYFSEKAARKGVAVGWSYEAGGTLGLLKPYYLQLLNSLEPGSLEFIIRSEKYSDETAERFLNIDRIQGASGFAAGLGELSVLPGLHGKLAMHFDWGAFDEFVKAMEAGVMVDVFFKKVPIMVESQLVGDTENQPIFINLFLNLQLGKRW